MKCPNEHELDQEITLGQVKVARCSTCLGLWFDQNELRKAQDEQTGIAEWLDADLWDNPENFRGAAGSRLCPKDASVMHVVNYGESNVSIDICEKCRGIWLDKDEFGKITDWLEGHASYELLHNYMKTLSHEGKEIFTGPEDLKSELHKFFIVLKYLQFRLVMGSPEVTKMLMSLPLAE